MKMRVVNLKLLGVVKKNETKKVHPNQGETGDLKELAKNKSTPTIEVKENNADLPIKSNKLPSLESLEGKDELKSKSINFENFNANISLNPEDNNQLMYNPKELRKLKSDCQIYFKRNDSTSSSKKKLSRSLSTSDLTQPVSISLKVKLKKFTKEKLNPFFNSSNRSLFNSNVLSNEDDILTDEFPDNKLMKNEEDEDNILEENLEENKEELINNNKINNSIKNTDLILEKMMDEKPNQNNDYTNTPENNSKKDIKLDKSNTSSINNSNTLSTESIIKLSLESVIANKDIKMSQDDLSLLEKKKAEKENESAYTLNEYGQSLFRLRYYLLQLKYLIDCNKELEQIVFYKLALSQYPDSNSVRTWLKRRITREPLVHGYCLPPFIIIDEEAITNGMFNRPLKNKIFHSLSLDKKYQVVEPLRYEFNRKVMGTSEHKSLVNCNSNLKYCQMKQRSDIVLRTIFIKRLFQKAPDTKRLIGNERFQSLKEKALINLQPRLSKHYRTEKNISNSMISIKLKTNKKKGIYLQHHSKKASYDFSSRNGRPTTNNNSLSPKPIDTINSNLHGSTYNKLYEKSKSFQNIFSSNSPSKLRNCHTLTESNHKYSYSQPLTHIIFNKQNNQYSIEPLPSINSSQRLFTKEKSFFSKYIFPSNANIVNGSLNHNINKSNSNMMMNNIGNGNIINNNNVKVLSNMNGSNININNINNNIRNNRNIVMSDMTLNTNNSVGMNMNRSSSNINNNISSYGYRKHSHISSISSIKEITNNSNCYNIDNVKSSIETVSKAKLNIVRNLNSNGNIDASMKNQHIPHDIANSNRKLINIQSQKSLNAFKDSDNMDNNFNQSDIINNYSDQDSVYSLSSNYYENDNSSKKDNNENNENNENNKSNENNENNENNIAADSNKTLVVYQQNNKKGNIFKKVLVLIKPKKQSDKKKKSSKNNSKRKDNKDKLNVNSDNIVDSEETINNSIEISRSYPSTSISNSNFSMNGNNNYSSDDTIHTNSRSIQNIKKVAIEKDEDIKKKKNSKWHIQLFKHSKSKVKN